MITVHCSLFTDTIVAQIWHFANLKARWRNSSNLALSPKTRQVVALLPLPPIRACAAAWRRGRIAHSLPSENPAASVALNQCRPDTGNKSLRRLIGRDDRARSKGAQNTARNKGRNASTVMVPSMMMPSMMARTGHGLSHAQAQRDYQYHTHDYHESLHLFSSLGRSASG